MLHCMSFIYREKESDLGRKGVYGTKKYEIFFDVDL